MAAEVERTTIEKDGEALEIIVYDDGSQRRVDNGRFVKPPEHTSITTSERGRELAQHKQRLYAEAAASAWAEALEMPNWQDVDSVEVWREINRIVARDFARSTNLRAKAELYEKARKAIGVPDRDKHSDNDSITAELLRTLEARRRYFETHTKDEVINGETEADESSADPEA